MIKKRLLIHPDNELIAGKLIIKYILVFSLTIISLDITAIVPLASKQEIGMFKDSQTCVVFQRGISLYNEYIKDAIQKYWKYTGYEFIDNNEFEKRKTNPKFSFIVLSDVASDKDPGGISYTYINLLLGNASASFKKMPEFCSIPLSYSGDTEVRYEYAIPAYSKIHADTY